MEVMTISSEADETSLLRHAKRRRVDSELAAEQDRDIWFDDGNIIVATTEETDDANVTHLFKCHKSLLSKYSPIFRDVFSLPQLFGGEEYEGLPAVLLPDPYKDVKGLLRMLYDPLKCVLL